MARTTQITNSIPPIGKYITYDRITKDFAYYLDGALVGYAATYLEAEHQLNALVYETLRRTPAVAAPRVTQDQAA